MAVGNQIVRIEPSILVWARETLGLTLREVAEKLDKDTETIQQWEYGKAFPTLAQLEKLAYAIYKRPLAVFFLPKPPLESTPKQDFRTLPTNEITKLSPELRIFIRKAKHHQLVLRQIHDNQSFVAKPIHVVFKPKVSNNPDKVAHDIREYLGVNRALQEKFKDSNEAFKYYRNLIEAQGIFVFQYPLKDARGFSLMDKVFPVIVLNSGDAPNGKIFTLFHELCHILFNTGGVFRDFYSGELVQSRNQVEIFCNKFASDFLLPQEDLLAEKLVVENGNSKEWDDGVLQQIADVYKVSKEVVLRKLLELGKTSQQIYLNLRNKWAESYKIAKENNDLVQNGGPSYHVKNLSHLGKNFVSQILNAYHSGKLTETQVADFLEIKLSKIKQYEEKVF